MDKTFDSKEAAKYRRFVGALALGAKPFAVIIGKEKHGAERIVLLDEIEAVDIRQLVRKCAALDYFYYPDWYGDTTNITLKNFIRESNKDSEAPNDRPFVLRKVKLIEMKNELYGYILPVLNDLIEQDQLILKPGMVKTYLSQLQENDLPDLEPGSYPSIEALAFCVLELVKVQRRGPRQSIAINEIF